MHEALSFTFYNMQCDLIKHKFSEIFDFNKKVNTMQNTTQISLCCIKCSIKRLYFQAEQ